MVKDENSRIRIYWSEARIRIRSKMSRIHNTGTEIGLLITNFVMLR